MVWARFERTMKDGSLKNFKIHEVPEGWNEHIYQFMIDNYMYEEPFSVASGVCDEPEGFEITKRFWKWALTLNTCMVCSEDGVEENQQPTIVSFNVLLRFVKGSDEIPDYAKEPVSLLRILDDVTNRFNVYEHFRVNEYLGDAGLAVGTAYRGLGIVGEMLNARIPLCKALGIKVTETIFTSKATQIAARKGGFEPLMELEYSVLEEKLNVKFPEGCKSLILMAKVID